MKLGQKITISLLTLAVVFLFSNGLTFYQAEAKDKGELKEVVFIHYKLPDSFDFGRPPKPGKPIASCQVTTNDNLNDWGATGWHMTTEGLTYKINTGTLPSGINADAFQNAMAASTNTWKQADAGLKWSYGGTTNVKRATYDGVNLIAFGSAKGAIAITTTWYWTGTGEVAESDMILSSGLAWSITNPSAGDCGGVPGTYDVQNIATHEFGHQVGLNDLYSSVDKDLTMYGYGTMTELKKDSLGTGDVTGAKAVAP
jgi:hypothetical protein